MTQKLSTCNYYVFQFAANRNMSRNEKAKKCSTLDLQNHLRKNANDMANDFCNYFSILQWYKSANFLLHLAKQKSQKINIKNWIKYLENQGVSIFFVVAFIFCKVRPLQIRFKGFHNFTATLPLHAKPQFFSFLHSKTEKRKTYISLFWVRRKIEQLLFWNAAKAIF